MKKLQLLFCLLFAFSASALADNLTPEQKKAQEQIYYGLEKKKLDPGIDKDNSVCFYSTTEFFWVTFEGNSPMLYTLHRRGFKVGAKGKGREKEPAIIAANEVNRKFKTARVVVEDSIANVTVCVYAAKPEDFVAVIDKYIDELKDVAKSFEAQYEKANTALKKQKAAAEETLRQKYAQPSELKGYINVPDGISFRMFYEGSNVAPQYDQPLRVFNARKLQMRLTVNPWKDDAKEFTLHYRIIRADGKVLTGDPGLQQNVTVEKSKKPVAFETSQLGDDKGSFWKAGEYKVQVLEGGDIIAETTFTLL